MGDSFGTDDANDADVSLDYHGYEDWKRWTAESFGTCSPEEAKYFAAELLKAGVVTCQGLRILEIGFGNGSFAGFVRSQNAEYLGVEMNGTLVERAKTHGFNSVVATDQQALPDEVMTELHYDLVAAFDVIEHLAIKDIEALLRSVRTILRPGGILIARVPSGDSPFGRAVFHGDVTHRSALGTFAIGQLAGFAQLEVAQIRPPAFPVLGAGLVRAFRRFIVLSARKLVSIAINQIFHDGHPCVISSNLVFVLRRPSDSKNLDSE